MNKMSFLKEVVMFFPTYRIPFGLNIEKLNVTDKQNL